MRTPIHGLTPRRTGRGKVFADRPLTLRRSERKKKTARSAQALSEQAARYARSFRLAIEVFAREHPAYEDLVFSSPVLTVSLVARRGPPAERGAALNLIRKEAPLSEIHAALELPFWLRKLPPEAFREAPPHPFPLGLNAAAIEDDAFDPRADQPFGSRALNLAPHDEWAGWLEWCAAARAAGDDALALWLLSHRLNWSRARPEQALGPLAACVWFSDHPHLPAAQFLPKEWTPEFALTAALRNARLWLLNLLFETSLSPATSPWRKSRRVRGYEFEPLIGVDAFVAEGIAMRNCMASYAEAAAEGRCRIYRLKRGGNSVANLELRPPAEPGGAPVIAQLLGRGNRRASAASVRAVQQWSNEIMAEIADQPEMSERDADPFAPPDPENWRLLMEPFLAAHPGAPLLGETLLDGPRRAVAALDRFRPLLRRRPARPRTPLGL